MCTRILHILHIYCTYITHIWYILYTTDFTYIILCICYTYTIQIVYIHLHMYGDTHTYIYIHIYMWTYMDIHRFTSNWIDKEQSMLVYLVALGGGRKHRRVRTESSRPGDDKKKQNLCWFELPWNVFQWCVVWGIHGYPS